MDFKGALRNYIDGEWRSSSATQRLPVINPATQERIAEVPLSPAAEIDQAARAAAAAFPEWRRTPAPDRVQFLFKLRNLLEQDTGSLAKSAPRSVEKPSESLGEIAAASKTSRPLAACLRSCRGPTTKILPAVSTNT